VKIHGVYNCSQPFYYPSSYHAMSVKFTDLIEKYDGEGDFSEWIAKLEFVAKLQKIEDLENFFPLFLTKGAFAVYKSVSADNDTYASLKEALTLAFSADKFQAYDQFVSRTLKPNESVDVYLADLQRLMKLVDASNASQNILKCAFVHGLPSELRQQMTAACSLEQMKVEEVVSRARSLRKMSTAPEFGCVSAKEVKSKEVSERICYVCRKSGHLKRDCPRRKVFQERSSDEQQKRYCFICGDQFHLANVCPERRFAPKNE